MPLVWIILVVMLGASGLLSDQLQRSDNRRQAVDVSALAHNLLIYRNALAEYAYNNPGITGTPADSALSLPSWWIHAPGVSGYVQSGSSYTFYTSPPNGLVTTLAELTHSVAVGYASDGQLVSPTGGATGIALPPQCLQVPQWPIVEPRKLSYALARYSTMDLPTQTEGRSILLALHFARDRTCPSEFCSNAVPRDGKCF